MTQSQQVAAAFTDALNAHDEQAIHELYAEEVVLEAPGELLLEGRAAALEYARAWLRAFPDATRTVHNQMLADDWVVHEFTLSGTHTETLVGPGFEIPATRNQLATRGVDLLRVENGRVAEERIYFDQLQVLAQLGLTAEPSMA